MTIFQFYDAEMLLPINTYEFSDINIGGSVTPSLRLFGRVISPVVVNSVVLSSRPVVASSPPILSIISYKPRLHFDNTTGSALLSVSKISGEPVIGGSYRIVLVDNGGQTSAIVQRNLGAQSTPITIVIDGTTENTNVIDGLSVVFNVGSMVGDVSDVGYLQQNTYRFSFRTQVGNAVQARVDDAPFSTVTTDGTYNELTGLPGVMVSFTSELTTETVNDFLNTTALVAPGGYLELSLDDVTWGNDITPSLPTDGLLPYTQPYAPAVAINPSAGSSLPAGEYQYGILMRKGLELSSVNTLQLVTVNLDAGDSVTISLTDPDQLSGGIDGHTIIRNFNGGTLQQLVNHDFSISTYTDTGADTPGSDAPTIGQQIEFYIRFDVTNLDQSDANRSLEIQSMLATSEHG